MTSTPPKPRSYDLLSKGQTKISNNHGHFHEWNSGAHKGAQLYTENPSDIESRNTAVSFMSARGKRISGNQLISVWGIFPTRAAYAAPAQVVNFIHLAE